MRHSRKVSMPNLLEFAVGALAVWRVSAMVAYERGPFAMFQHIRDAAGIKHFDDGSPDTDDLKGELARLLSCVWCLSPYFALVWLAWWATLPDFTMAASYIFALSTVSVLIERFIDG